MKKVLFIVDVRDWAYHNRAKIWQRLLLNEFEIDIMFLEDYPQINKDNKDNLPLFDHEIYDGIMFFYHRAIVTSVLTNTPIPKEKVAICINNDKWSLDGSSYTFNKYFRGVKLITGCNDNNVKEFKQYGVRVIKVTQVVDETIFNIQRKELVTKHKGSNFIVGWSGDPDNQIKNVKWLSRACYEADVKLNIQKELTLKQLSKWYNTVDCVICVSQIEGGPNMILEAGACGIPIISTPVGLAPEIIQDKQNGFLIPHNRLDILIDRIKKLVNSNSLRSKYASNIHTTILKTWTYEKRLYEIRSALNYLCS